MDKQGNPIIQDTVATIENILSKHNHTRRKVASFSKSNTIYIELIYKHNSKIYEISFYNTNERYGALKTETINPYDIVLQLYNIIMYDGYMLPN